MRKKKSSDSKRKVIKSYETVSDEDDMVRNSLVFREKCSEKVEGVPIKDVLSVDCGKSEQVDEIDMVEPDGELDNIFAQPVAVGESEEVAGKKSRGVVGKYMIGSEKGDDVVNNCVDNEVLRIAVSISTKAAAGLDYGLTSYVVDEIKKDLVIHLTFLV